MVTLEYQPPRTRVRAPLRLHRLVLCTWVPAALLGMSLGMMACLSYNRTAGTDLTPLEIAGIALSMNTGPLVGPLQGRNPTNDFYGVLIPIGLGALLLAWLPIVALRGIRTLPWQVVMIACHVAGTAAWYLCALASLAYHLS
jgi:hypothetical protein